MATTVTVEYEVYQGLQDQLRAAKAELEDARKRVEEVKLGDPDSLLRLQLHFIMKSLDIVRWVMGSTTPMMMPGWPHQALREIAEMLPEIPGMPPELQEMKASWIMYADEAKKWQDARENGTIKQLLAEENAQKGCDLGNIGIGGDIGTTIKPG